MVLMFLIHAWVWRTLVALLALATASVIAVPPASAERAHWSDPSGDGWTWGDRGDDETRPYPIGGVMNADIASVSVRHRRYALTIRTTFHRLERPTDPDYQEWEGHFGFEAVIRTNEGVRRNLHSGWRWFYGPIGEDLGLSNREGRAVACTMTNSTDWEAKTMYVRIPRSCLSRPRWVQVAVGAKTWGIYVDPVDDARTTKYWNSSRPDSWTRRLFRA
jgi:hypothetical protein